MPTVVIRPEPSPRGRPRIDWRRVVSGILFVGAVWIAWFQGSTAKLPGLDFAPSKRNTSLQVDGLPPPGYSIKGNISVTTGAKLYHVPGMRDYEVTVVDTSRGERWFRTEAEAEANGWRKAGR